MEIKAFDDGIFGATTYLVFDKTSKEAFLVDMTSKSDEIKKIILDNNLNLKYILITHGHFDHVYELDKMKSYFPNAKVYLNSEDKALLSHVSEQCAMACVKAIEVPKIDVFFDDSLEEKSNLSIGSKEIKIIHTKGHSKGGTCYLIENTLFSGDTLFKGSIGRCDLFGGDFGEIEDSIKNKLFTLPPETTVYAGHGAKTTIGYEKLYNPYFGEN